METPLATYIGMNNNPNSSAPATGGGVWLKVGSDEYDTIQHYLNATLYGRGEVFNVEIWKIDNPDLSVRFERSASSLLKVTSLIDCSSLGVDNSLNDVCNRGFVFKNGGMEFTTGQMPQLKPVGKHGGVAGEDDEYQIIYADIAIGRAFVCDQEETSQQLPLGYDSYYIPAMPLDRNKDGELSIIEYKEAASFDGRNAS